MFKTFSNKGIRAYSDECILRSLRYTGTWTLWKYIVEHISLRLHQSVKSAIKHVMYSQLAM